MKVCFFSQYSLTNNAGASLSMFNIANEMATRGIDVTIILANNKNIADVSIDDRIRLIYIPFKSMRMTMNKIKWNSYIKFAIKSLYNKYAAKVIIASIKENKPDVIHINGLDNAIGAEVANAFKIPYVWHIRQFLEDDFGQKLFGEKYIYSLVQKASDVIAISEDVKKNFEPKFKRSIKVIYNGIPQEIYDIPDHEILLHETVKLLLAGRILVQKGQMTAIKAIEILQNKGRHNLTLTLIGQGETKEYLQYVKNYVAEHKLNEIVEIKEHSDDLLEIRREHDIGLTCSQREAFGRVTVENMMAGMLVIGADSGGTPEIITDGANGFLYQTDDPESLASVIEKAIDDVEFSRRIAKTGYENSVARFSIKRVVDEVVSIYEKII